MAFGAAGVLSAITPRVFSMFSLFAHGVDAAAAYEFEWLLMFEPVGHVLCASNKICNRRVYAPKHRVYPPAAARGENWNVHSSSPKRPNLKTQRPVVADCTCLNGVLLPLQICCGAYGSSLCFPDLLRRFSLFGSKNKSKQSKARQSNAQHCKAKQSKTKRSECYLSRMEATLVHRSGSGGG